MPRESLPLGVRARFSLVNALDRLPHVPWHRARLRRIYFAAVNWSEDYAERRVG